MIGNVNNLLGIIIAVITILSNFIIVLRFTWKVATKLGEIERRLSKVEYDLNNLKIITKEMVSAETWKLQIQLTHIQEHLEEKSDYHAPSFQRYSKE